MDAQFWQQRWRDNLIGFHQETVNPHLERFWPQVVEPTHATTLVPLCGKSRDMVWLGARAPVLGVELSERAVTAFFREQGLQPRRRREGAFACWQSGGVTLYCGDFFTLEPAQTGVVDAIYDRAALIALPQPMRPAYAAQLTALAAPGCRLLLITLAYPQTQMNGPPFSVDEAEVEALFGNHWQIRPLLREDILERESRFRERGLSRLAEQVYVLQKPPA